MQQRDKYTGATLSAAAQTQVGNSPAVNRDLCLFMRVVCVYVCVCVTLCAWHQDSGRVLSRRKVSPSGSRVITREHRRDKKNDNNINGITGQRGAVPGESRRRISSMFYGNMADMNPTYNKHGTQ